MKTLHKVYGPNDTLLAEFASIRAARKYAADFSNERGCEVWIDNQWPIAPERYLGQHAIDAYKEGVTGCLFSVIDRSFRLDSVDEADKLLSLGRTVFAYPVNLSEVEKRHARWSKGRP